MEPLPERELGPLPADVLLVDDYEDTRDTLSSLLESEGYRVICASDGQDALEKLRGGIAPRLILLDLQMPRMGGFEFRAEQLKDPALARIPVVICSASDAVTAMAAIMRVAHHVAKPVDRDLLLAIVGHYCGRRE